MGLPIVKGLITAHDGNVLLYSAPEQGTEVVIQLPLVRDQPV